MSRHKTEVIIWNRDLGIDGDTAHVGNWLLCATERYWSVSDGRNEILGPARDIDEAKRKAEHTYTEKRKVWR